MSTLRRRYGHALALGDRAVARVKLPEGFRIDRVVSRIAYAKSGNAHNPTPSFRWEVYYRDRLAGTYYSLKKARIFVREQGDEIRKEFSR